MPSRSALARMSVNLRGLAESPRARHLRCLTSTRVEDATLVVRSWLDGLMTSLCAGRSRTKAVHTSVCVGAVICSLIVSPVVSTPDAQAAQNCGPTSVRSGTTGKTFRISVRVRRGRASCGSARAIMRRYFRAKCQINDGMKCSKRVGDWVCTLATAGDLPRLASCDRGRTVVSAYQRSHGSTSAMASAASSVSLKSARASVREVIYREIAARDFAPPAERRATCRRLAARSFACRFYAALPEESEYRGSVRITIGRCKTSYRASGSNRICVPGEGCTSKAFVWRDAIHHERTSC